MKNISILLLGLLFLGCNTTKFPDKIVSNLTEDHFRIKGTKLFVKSIERFTYTQDVNVFKYSDSVFIHCLYITHNFERDYANQKMYFRLIISSEGLIYGTSLYNNIEDNISLTDSILKTVKIKNNKK
jgi:hypothetical protein